MIKQKGFSLIELLVVVGITGVLAAVAIPAYNRYSVNAAQSAVISSLNNIGKGHSACLALNQWADCNTLAEMEVDCPNCTGLTDRGTSLCVEAHKKVGGTTYKGCVQSSGSMPRITGNWKLKCTQLSEIHVCSATNTWAVSPVSACPSPCTSPTLTTGNCMVGPTPDVVVSCLGAGSATGQGKCALSTGTCL